MARTVTIEWPDFKTTVPLSLLDDQSPRLCEAFWNSLPFETLFVGSMSGGQMFKVPLPLCLPDDPSAKRVLLPDQPPGSVVVFAGSTLLVKYGAVIEPFRLPLIGVISNAGLSRLAEVRDTLLEDYWVTKAIHRAVFSKAAEK